MCFSELQRFSSCTIVSVSPPLRWTCSSSCFYSSDTDEVSPKSVSFYGWFSQEPIPAATADKTLHFSSCSSHPHLIRLHTDRICSRRSDSLTLLSAARRPSSSSSLLSSCSCFHFYSGSGFSSSSSPWLSPFGSLCFCLQKLKTGVCQTPTLFWTRAKYQLRQGAGLPWLPWLLWLPWWPWPIISWDKHTFFKRKVVKGSFLLFCWSLL